MGFREGSGFILRGIARLYACALLFYQGFEGVSELLVWYMQCVAVFTADWLIT